MIKALLLNVVQSGGVTIGTLLLYAAMIIIALITIFCIYVIICKLLLYPGDE